MSTDREIRPDRGVASRTRTLGIALLGALVWVSAAGAGSAQADATQDITPESILAVERALDSLARTQNPDGSWTGTVGFKLNQSYQVTAREVPHVGVTALAGLAFLSAGHLPDRGKYGDRISRATDYVLSCVQENGLITAHGTRMYSHAFATLFLAEVYGMKERQDIRSKLQAAVDLIVASQNREGAWRYVPYAVESDMSIAVCQLNALRGARNVGIRVPKSTIDRAKGYVAASYVESNDERFRYPDDYYRLGRGSFKYQATRRSNTRSSFALTAAGIAALHNSGLYGSVLEGEGGTMDMQASIDFLEETYPNVSGSSPYTFHYFYWYGHYYAVQALYVVGGKHWAWYYPRIRDELVRTQQASGAWPCTHGPGPAFSTAVGAVILSLPYGYLPIFQR
ncbi:MAG: prenyltransferase/squalene oxidase repeat-containing protein [Planctomycetota bacterium]|jgi:hypothetical protein